MEGKGNFVGDVDQHKAAKLRAEAAGLLIKAAQLDSSYDAMLPLCERIEQRKCSVNSNMGEFIQFHIEQAECDVVEVLARIAGLEGGKETEVYRCLQQCAAALHVAGKAIKPGSVFCI